MSKIKIQEKFQISFCKILRKKWYHAKELRKRFHLNGHTIGFRSQTQEFELYEMIIISGIERVKAVEFFLDAGHENLNGLKLESRFSLRFKGLYIKLSSQRGLNPGS